MLTTRSRCFNYEKGADEEGVDEEGGEEESSDDESCNEEDVNDESGDDESGDEEGGHQLVVKSLTGQSCLVDCKHSDLIEEIKKKIAGDIYLPFDKQVLVYRGQCLEDNQTLGFYEILNELEDHPFEKPTIIVYDTRLVCAVDDNDKTAVTSYFDEISLKTDYVDDEGHGHVEFAAHAGHVGIV